MVYRTDRFSRGGDQVEMLKAGFPAVRVTEAVENYTRQHQDLRTEKGIKYGDTVDGVDFAYLAQVTRLNVVDHGGPGLWRRPRRRACEIAGAVSADTTVKWTTRAGCGAPIASGGVPPPSRSGASPACAGTTGETSAHRRQHRRLVLRPQRHRHGWL